MNDYLAMALMDIGKNLPGQLRANRLEKMNADDKRRQYMSDDLVNELSKLQIQSEKNKISTDQTARDRDKSALDALAEATSGMQRQKQFSDLNKLEEHAGIKPADYNIQSSRDIATGTGLTNYGDNEAVKSWMKTNVEDPENNALKEKNNGNKSLDPDELQFGNKAGLVSWFNKPEKVKETLEQLEYFKNQYNLPENDYEVLKKQAQTGQSYDVRLYMTDLLKGSQKNKLRTELEYGLIDPRTITKSETTEAGIKSTEKTEQDIYSGMAIPGLKPIKGVRITEDSIKKIKGVQPDVESMKKLADDLINKYKTMGSVFTGDGAADYSSKVRNLQLLAKSPALYNLGVLTGPDLRLLEESIPNPASIKEGAKKQILGDLSVRLNNFRDLVDSRAKEFYRTNGFESEQKASSKLSVGQVVNGYRYKGGNSKDQNSWEKVQ